MLPLLLVCLSVLSTSLAAPSSSTPCTVALRGNLSPNHGVSGNFRLVNGLLAFDPMNVDTRFDVSLQSCNSVANAAASHSVIAGTTGQCLAIRNETTVQGNTVTGVDCAGTMPAMSWAISNGFLFSTAAATSTCPSGLYGYQADSSTGSPPAIQKGPITLGCSTASNVFGFNVLA